MAIIINPFVFGGAAAPSVFDNTYSVDFDGINDYVDLGDTLDYGTFTISAWVKADVLSASIYEGIIAKRGASNPTKQFNLSLDNANKFYFWIFESDGTYIDIFSNSAIVVDTWYHVLAVADGSTLKMYVDGTLQTDTASYDGTFQDSGSTTKIGENQTHMWTGNIDEVAYWDVALDADAVTALYNSGSPIDLSSDSGNYDNSSDLVAWYRMGDGDTYPMLNNGQAYSHRSVEFDGVNDYVEITDSGTAPTDFQGMGNNNDYSFFCWIKTTGGSSSSVAWMSGSTIVGLRQENSSGTKAPFSFGVTVNKLHLGRAQNTYLQQEIKAGATAVNDGNWHHVGFTVDDDAWVLYLDGSPDGSGSFTTATGDCSVGTTTSNFQFGCRSKDNGVKNSELFDGNIDEPAFWDVALDADAVTALYNSGSPIDLSSDSGNYDNSGDLIGWWKMGDGDTHPTLTDSGSGSNDGTMSGMSSANITGAQTTGTMNGMSSANIEEDVP